MWPYRPVISALAEMIAQEVEMLYCANIRFVYDQGKFFMRNGGWLAYVFAQNQKTNSSSSSRCFCFSAKVRNAALKALRAIL